MSHESTNDVFNKIKKFNVIQDDSDIVRLDDIWNSYVPWGNQITVDEHSSWIRSAQRSLKETYKKSKRCDYHECDTGEFIAFCNEMHICSDNDTYGVEKRNKELYEKFKNNIGNEYPIKHKYIMIVNGEKIIHNDYVGISPTQEEIKQFEQRENAKSKKKGLLERLFS